MITSAMLAATHRSTATLCLLTARAAPYVVEHAMAGTRSRSTVMLWECAAQSRQCPHAPPLLPSLSLAHPCDPFLFIPLLFECAVLMFLEEVSGQGHGPITVSAMAEAHNVLTESLVTRFSTCIGYSISVMTPDLACLPAEITKPGLWRMACTIRGVLCIVTVAQASSRNK
jgi:hypothetical protein